ncbi:MAG: hypothetical protein Q9178_007087 [Gyalolechia marmorata]
MSVKPTSRPWAYRLENIPLGTTKNELKASFQEEDRPYLTIKSLVPAVDNPDCAGDLTAVVIYRPDGSCHPHPRLTDETLSMDQDFHGLTPLYQPHGAIEADIIAVAGLAGHAYGSWAQRTGDMWLQDYLPRDVPNARVMIYGYDASLEGKARNILLNLTQEFMYRISEMRSSAQCESRPVILIGHDLGCLIIKKTLVDINGFFTSSLRLPVSSLIFFGAPHRGLETSALQTIVKSQPLEELVQELQTSSPTLRELNDKFRHVVGDISILTCYETVPTKTAIKVSYDYMLAHLPNGQLARQGEPKLLVPFHSATLDLPREQPVPCNGDHSQIAKVRRSEASKYYAVKGAVIKAIGSVSGSLDGALDPEELAKPVATLSLSSVQPQIASKGAVLSRTTSEQAVPPATSSELVTEEGFCRAIRFGQLTRSKEVLLKALVCIVPKGTHIKMAVSIILSYMPHDSDKKKS